MPRVTVEHVKERGTFVGKVSRECGRAFGEGRELALLLLDLAEKRDVCDRRDQRDRKAGRRYQICGPCRCVLHCEYLPKGAFEALRRGCVVPLPPWVRWKNCAQKSPDFPGYDGDLERRRSDEYVRSYLGEALAELAARGALPPELRQRVDELVLRVGFADRATLPRTTSSVQRMIPSEEGAVASADAATVELADHAASVDAASAAAISMTVAAVLGRTRRGDSRAAAQ